MTVDSEALSRVQLASVPFALEAAVAQQVSWLDVAGVPTELSDGDDTLTSAEVGTFANAEGFAQLEHLNDGITTTAPVGWSDLTGVPTYVSDGDDTLSSAEVRTFAADEGFAQIAHLNDGITTTAAVGWSDLTGIPPYVSDGDNTLSPTEVGTFAGAQGYVHEDDLSDADPETVVVDWRDLTIPNVITLSPGDDIQSVVGGITDATADNPYLVWLAPGVNTVLSHQKIYLTPNIHLQGSGREVTVIRAGNNGPLELASMTSVSNLRIERTGATLYSEFVRVINAEGATIRDVDIVQLDAVSDCYGIYALGADTSLEVERVNVVSEGRDEVGNDRTGIIALTGSTVRVVGGRVTVETGNGVTGVNVSISSTVTLSGVDISATGAMTTATGVSVSQTAGNVTTFVMRGGSITADGAAARGIEGYGNHDVSGVDVHALGGNADGLHIETDAVSTFRHGSIEGGVYVGSSGDLTLSHVDIFNGSVYVHPATGLISCHLVSVDDGETQCVTFAQPDSCVPD